MKQSADTPETKVPPKKKRCQMRPAGTPKSVLVADHRAKMSLKRTQGARLLPAGFRPVRNETVQGGIEAHAALLQMTNPEMTAVEARHKATEHVSKLLPSAPFARKRHARPTPSRSDDPAYRKSIWPEGKVAQPGRMG